MLFKLTKLAVIGAGSLHLAFATEINSHLITLGHQHSLHYYEMGDSGSPLILLTGYATTSNFWNTRFVECLAAKHQVYLFDYQGVNTPNKHVESLSLASMATDVNQLAKQLKLQNPALIGWSMGGGVALQASFSQPSYYHHLYLLASILPTTKGDLLLPQPQLPKFSSNQQILDYVFSKNLASYNQASLSTLQAQFIIPQVSGLFPDQSIITRQDQAMQAWITDPTVAKLFSQSPVPATFYLAGKDRILQESTALRLTDSYPNATVTVAKNSGHAMAWEEPLQVCQDILQQESK